MGGTVGEERIFSKYMKIHDEKFKNSIRERFNENERKWYKEKWIKMEFKKAVKNMW